MFPDEFDLTENFEFKNSKIFALTVKIYNKFLLQVKNKIENFTQTRLLIKGVKSLDPGNTLKFAIEIKQFFDYFHFPFHFSMHVTSTNIFCA